jgi:hypothetical protein
MSVAAGKQGLVLAAYPRLHVLLDIVSAVCETLLKLLFPYAPFLLTPSWENTTGLPASVPLKPLYRYPHILAISKIAPLQ